MNTNVFFVVLGELEISISASWDRYWAYHILARAENFSESQHNFQIEVKHQTKPKGLWEEGVSLDSSWIYPQIPSDFSAVQIVTEHQVGPRMFHSLNLVNKRG